MLWGGLELAAKGPDLGEDSLGKQSRRKSIVQPFRIFYSLARPSVLEADIRLKVAAPSGCAAKYSHRPIPNTRLNAVSPVCTHASSAPHGFQQLSSPRIIAHARVAPV